MTDDRSRGGERGMPPGGATSGSVPLEQDFDADSLYALRSAVGAHTAAAGLSPGRVYDVVAVAHELAANAILHGGGHGHLRLWASSGVLTCQVSDDGSAGADPDDGRGRGRAPWPSSYAHGLWLVRELADQIGIYHSPAGTTVTAIFRLRPRP